MADLNLAPVVVVNGPNGASPSSALAQIAPVASEISHSGCQPSQSNLQDYREPASANREIYLAAQLVEPSVAAVDGAYNLDYIHESASIQVSQPAAPSLTAVGPSVATEKSLDLSSRESTSFVPVVTSSCEKPARTRWSQRFSCEEGKLSVHAELYHVSKLSICVYIAMCVLSGGIFFLLSRWFPRWWLRIFGTSVTDPASVGFPMSNLYTESAYVSNEISSPFGGARADGLLSFISFASFFRTIFSISSQQATKNSDAALERRRAFVPDPLCRTEILYGSNISVPASGLRAPWRFYASLSNSWNQVENIPIESIALCNTKKLGSDLSYTSDAASGKNNLNSAECAAAIPSRANNVRDSMPHAANATGGPYALQSQQRFTPTSANSQTALMFDSRVAVSGAEQGTFSGEVCTDANCLDTENTFERVVFFEYRSIRYAWNPAANLFVTACNMLDVRSDLSHLERLALMGPNEIVIPNPSLQKCLIDQLQHPFYIFQVFSMILWYCDEYEKFATVILFMTLCSIFTSIYQIKVNTSALIAKTKFSCPVKVKRDGRWTVVDSLDLVPGDLICLSTRDSVIVPCDAVLLSGDCIVHESMLTGESVPVSKFPASSLEFFDSIDMEDPQVPGSLCKSFLFGGTQLLRVRPEFDSDITSMAPQNTALALAIVVRTGFNMTKGTLIRSMLYPRPHVFKFYRESMLFVLFMFFISTLFMIATLTIMVKTNQDISVIIRRVLDVVTIVVPPALPATLAIGTVIAARRLIKFQIFCISPNHINVTGKVDYICFDKTGTITEDGMNVFGVLPVEEKQVQFFELERSPANLDGTKMLEAMATCHELKMFDNSLIGDPLDIRMFEWTDWRLFENTVTGTVRPANGDSDRDVCMVKCFEFLSEYRRMSVVTKKVGISNPFCVFCKGAPESIREICFADTIPADFDERLESFARSGFRVIGIAYREFPGYNLAKMERMTRIETESEMTFIGLMLFENKIKDGSTDTIHTLNSSDIRTSMCTGDNVLTAISVGKDCGILERDVDVFVAHIAGKQLYWRNMDAGSSIFVDPVTVMAVKTPKKSGLPVGAESSTANNFSSVSLLAPVSTMLINAAEEGNLTFTGRQQGPLGPDFALAITGKDLEWMLENYDAERLSRIFFKTQIFARMTPDQKKCVVEEIQRLGYIVSFCGDGANDCSALKASDIGVSLSQSEASVASSFTSATMKISCMIDLIRQGRAALTTSFSCFKFMALYSMIQASGVVMINYFGHSFSDTQFLTVDLFFIIPLATAMARARAYPRLVVDRPVSSLISKYMLTSVVFHTILQFVILGVTLVNVKGGLSQVPFLNGHEFLEAPFPKSTENSTVFIFSAFSLTTVAICFFAGPPFRMPLYKTISFMLTVTAILVLMIVLLFGKIAMFNYLLDVFVLNTDQATHIIVAAFVHFVIAILFERFLLGPTARLLSRVHRVCKKSLKSIFFSCDAKSPTIENDKLSFASPRSGEISRSNEKLSPPADADFSSSAVDRATAGVKYGTEGSSAHFAGTAVSFSPRDNVSPITSKDDHNICETSSGATRKPLKTYKKPYRRLAALYHR